MNTQHNSIILKFLHHLQVLITMFTMTTLSKISSYMASTSVALLAIQPLAVVTVHTRSSQSPRWQHSSMAPQYHVENFKTSSLANKTWTTQLFHLHKACLHLIATLLTNLLMPAHAFSAAFAPSFNLNHTPNSQVSNPGLIFHLSHIWCLLCLGHDNFERYPTFIATSQTLMRLLPSRSAMRLLKYL